MYTLALSNNVLYIQHSSGQSPQSYDLSLFIATVIENDLQVVEIATGFIAAYITFDQLVPIEGVGNMVEMSYYIGLDIPPPTPAQQVEVTNPQETVEVTNTVDVSEVALQDYYLDEPFSIDYETKTYTLPAINKFYVLFLFRAKQETPVVTRTVLQAVISALSETADDFLINVCINPTLDAAIEDIYWQDVHADSNLQYLRPKITGLSGHASVPANIEVTARNRPIFSKYCLQQTMVWERIDNVLQLPSDKSKVYAIVASSQTASCKLHCGLSFIEKPSS